jgi:DnaJ family protein A protein 5
LFALLASDEGLHAEKPLTYPSFGDSTTPYAPPPDMPRAERYNHTWARDFYLVWSDFATAKRFEWVAKWDAEKGDDRSMRRLMEKENKKLREDYRRDYNDTVQVSER